MNREDIAREVASVISTVLKCRLDTQADVSRAGLLAWDSLKHVEIMLAVEESLDHQFSEQEFAELNSLDAIVNAVLNRHAA